MKWNHSQSHATRNWCFQRELYTQETFLGLPFSATQTAVLLSHHLTCSLSQPPILESQGVLFSCRAGADVPGFLSPPTSGPWAELTSTSGISPDLHMHVKGYQEPSSLPWTWFEHITLHKNYSSGGIWNIHITLSALCFWTRVKKSHYLSRKKKKKSIASFGICLHTSSTFFSALWWWWWW